MPNELKKVEKNLPFSLLPPMAQQVFDIGEDLLSIGIDEIKKYKSNEKTTKETLESLLKISQILKNLGISLPTVIMSYSIRQQSEPLTIVPQHNVIEVKEEGDEEV